MQGGGGVWGTPRFTGTQICWVTPHRHWDGEEWESSVQGRAGRTGADLVQGAEAGGRRGFQGLAGEWPA